MSVFEEKEKLSSAVERDINNENENDHSFQRFNNDNEINLKNEISPEDEQDGGPIISKKELTRHCPMMERELMENERIDNAYVNKDSRQDVVVDGKSSIAQPEDVKALTEDDNMNVTQNEILIVPLEKDWAEMSKPQESKDSIIKSVEELSLLNATIPDEEFENANIY